MTKPYPFDEFFSSGLEESVSPFLTHTSRNWGKNLPLRSSLCAALLLFVSFLLSLISPPLSHLGLLFVYFLVGTPALIATIQDIQNFEINIDVLMTLSAFIAILIGSPMEGSLLLVLFALSHGMESLVSKKAKSSLHHLNQIAPKFAYVIAEDKTLFEKSIREIAVGTHLFIKSGEIVPLDGVVIEGKSSMNLVHLTGESLPIPKKPGDFIPAGARNLEEGIVLEVKKTSSDSTLAKIIELITQAQEAKPKLQRWLDRFSRRYATSIIALTALFALCLPFLFAISYFGLEGSIYRALAFLIAASPCALIIATPTAYLSAISACAKKGVLLKGGITLDALASCKTIAFDKTGTLTTGVLACTRIETLEENPPLSIAEALSIAYSLERHVVHPIASAIVKYAEERKAPLLSIEAFQSIPGFGLKGRFENKPLFIGLFSKIEETLPEELQKQAKKHLAIASEKGEMVAALLIDQSPYLFFFSDQLRPDIAPLIQTIYRLGLTPLMLTGDREENAKAIASAIGLSDYKANLRPEDKLNQVAALSQQGGLAMVGDGMNDAPALARATVGISMGKVGSASAIDASDVVLLADEIPAIGWLFSKAFQTKKIVRQNITLALCVILFATTPALLGYIPLWLAVVLHEGGTVLVGLNSLRLLKR